MELKCHFPHSVSAELLFALCLLGRGEKSRLRFSLIVPVYAVRAAPPPCWLETVLLLFLLWIADKLLRETAAASPWLVTGMQTLHTPLCLLGIGALLGFLASSCLQGCPWLGHSRQVRM